MAKRVLRGQLGGVKDRHKLGEKIPSQVELLCLASLWWEGPHVMILHGEGHQAIDQAVANTMQSGGLTVSDYIYRPVPITILEVYIRTITSNTPPLTPTR